MSSARFKYADVAVPIPGSRPLTYALSDDICGLIRAGMRVKVPVASRQMVGWVVGLRAETSVAVKPISELMDHQPCLDQEMLDLTAWVAGYYHCSWGEAIKTALPPGISVKQHPVIRFGPNAGQVTADAVRLFSVLKDKGAVNEKQALRLLGNNPETKLRSFMNSGQLQRDMTWQKVVASKHQRWLVLVKAGQLSLRAAGQKWLLDELSEKKELPSGTVISLSSANALVRKGMARWESRQLNRLPEGPEWEEADGNATLTPDQKSALEQITEDLNSGAFRVNLIHGVTGSGKTELYIRAAEEAIRMGKSVLILVPEIGLTAQMILRVKRRFPEAAVWHSGLSLGERLDEWERIKRGGSKVVVGTRSAVFAPLTGLGLIVIDEEQDASYKQSEARPYYNARDVSIIRASRIGASVILGSATPSVESYFKAVKGKFRLFSWARRAGQSVLPQVRLVDIKLDPGRKDLISDELSKELQRTIEGGQQAMLLLNRRGYAPYVQCRACGHIVRCPNCSISLTYHRPERRMLCHYCGHYRKAFDLCPSCHKPGLSVSGTAIQGLEDELKRLFPSVGILRMDADTTSTKGGHQRIIGKFMKKEAPILIGTQMISKGHDFPDVTLVGIVNADDLLGVPDFRSQERAFQLVTQMAGRSGRGELPGQVILQTRDPGNPVMRMAQKHDYLGFWEQEIREREEHDYPPFSRLVLITISSADARSGEEQGVSLVRDIGSWPELQVLGPVPAPVFKVRGRFRWHIVLKAKEQGSLSKCLAMLPVRVKGKRLSLAVDVDPASLT